MREDLSDDLSPVPRLVEEMPVGRPLQEVIKLHNDALATLEYWNKNCMIIKNQIFYLR